MNEITQLISELEKNCPCTVPGTSITRVLLEPSFWEQEKVSGLFKGSCLVWCVGWGQMNMPKEYAYGKTIIEALKKRLA